ncbi:DUF4158 domain-containing protein [Deinococcus fonticola]|uniref:DUF4158 domain-containing protein n=1 Tax=Deinococcus fonticola TaxID=2528713 RepID=UPI001074EFC9|nr:DUF4158 domain-containing protein [Deinococcus fonticola]
MGFDFLTDEDLALYGRFRGDPSPQQFHDFFHLDEEQLKRIAELRHPHTKLGFALQLTTLKFLGTFLSDPLAVPDSVIRTLAVQLQLPRSIQLHRYLDRRETRFNHQTEIRKMLGYKDFDAVEVLHLMRFLYAHLLVTDERPIELFDRLTQRLIQRHVILPGPTVLAQIVVRVRERVMTRLHRQITARLDANQTDTLAEVLVVPEKQRRSRLDVLRTPPTRQKSPGLIQH